MSELIESKNRLCKMLAMEDLNIIHKKGIRTAAIDLKSRTVYLPVWKKKDGSDLPGAVHDILISHEGYGHGRNTPKEGWHSSIGKHSRAFKSFLNIIEDARIEKLVKQKYPGIKKSYIEGYKYIVDNGIFGKNILARVNDGSMKFIDRLNVHAKVGSYAAVNFTNEEMVYVDRMAALKTWKEVVKLSEDLFKKAKEDKENEKSETHDGNMPQPNDSTGVDESGDAGDDADDASDAGDDADDASDAGDDADDAGDAGDEDDKDSDNDSSKKEDKKFESGNGHEGGDDSNLNDDKDLTAETDGEFEDNLKDLVADDYNSENHKIYTLPKVDKINEIIIGYKTVIKENTAHYIAEYALDETLKKVRIWKRDNMKVVNYLVKEFEMKKAADEYVRHSEAKTGVLDPAKLHSYKFNDDIFKKVTSIVGGKNHGLLMYLDWSGSMSNNISGTMDQLFNLVSFCRKVNMPFHVYAFSDAYSGTNRIDMSPAVSKINDMELGLSGSLRLLELFSSNMNGADFNKMLVFAKAMADGMSGGYYSESRPSDVYRLGGTPLNGTIIAAMQMVKEFRAKNNLQVVNTVFLTDGASSITPVWEYSEEKKEIRCTNLYNSSYHTTTIVKDPVTKKEYNISDTTKGLLEALRDIAGVNVAGFFLTSSKIRSFRNVYRFFNTQVYTEKDVLYKEFKKEKFLISTDAGYNELYIIADGGNLKTANTNMDDLAIDATKAQLKKAFMKAGKGKLKNRIVLSKFIDMVA